MYVAILILSQLMQGPKHGYEIKKDAELRLGDAVKINHNSLYPALKQMEQMGAIEKHVEIQEGKPNRHMYMMTELGEEILIEMIKDFPPEKVMNDCEFYTRAALFDLIDGEERRIILNKRKAEVQHLVTKYEKMKKQQLDNPEYHNTIHLINLMKQQKEKELEWLDEALAAQ